MRTLAIHGGTPVMADQEPLPSWPQPRAEDENALRDVLWSGAWGSTQGAVSSDFAEEFARYQEAAHGITVGNGTLGLVAALRACGVGLGDEVVVPPYTFIATASAALFVGAVPVFADVDPTTHLMDPDAVENVITDRTRAIVPVHLAGRPADMDAFRALGDRHGLRVIEDCAQAIGSAYRGRAVGAIGDVGVFSFQSSKNMTSGEGGAIVTDDDALADALYSLVNVGRVRDGGWYEHRSVGYNLRMTEFQAAILRGQLRRHPMEQRVRERNARILDAELRRTDEEILLPSEDPAVTRHGHHLYLLRLPALGAAGLRDTAVRALGAEGVTASPGYVPLHRNEPLVSERRTVAERLGRPAPEDDCPHTDLLASDTVWLPQTMLLGSEQQTRTIARVLVEIAGSVAELRAARDTGARSIA